MKKILKIIFFSILCSTLFTTTANAGTYDIDPIHTTVGFSAKHLVISNVRGEFNKYTGYFSVDDKWNVLDINVNIDAASIDTKNQKRDTHLKSPDFLDVEKTPKITFIYKKTLTKEGNQYQIAGDLTIHGVTKEIVIDCELLGKVKDPWGNMRSGLTANARIDRRDYGLVWNKLLETGGLVVGNTIKINLEIEGILRKKKK